MGISTLEKVLGYEAKAAVAIPFRVGWGFPPIVVIIYGEKTEIMSQSLSGWDGDFHVGCVPHRGAQSPSRNPFQGGMGISTQ